MDSPPLHGENSLVFVDPPPIFTELLELYKYDDGCQEWKEVSRWIKYEEDVLEQGNRWSRPHVSTPSLESWLSLRQNFRSGLIMIDFEAKDFSHLIDLVNYQLMQEERVTQDQSVKLKELWKKKHRHQFEGPRKVEGNLSKVIKDLLVQKLENKAVASGLRVPSRGNSQPGSRRGSFQASRQLDDTQPATNGTRGRGLLDDGKVNIYLQKKIIPGSEAFIILEGMVGFIEKPISVFIRMAKPIVLGDLPEVDIPTRYIYFFLAPITQSGTSPDDNTPFKNASLGVSLATAMTDKNFAAAIFNAPTSKDVLDAFDGYTHGLKILPRDFDTETNMIEPPANKSAAKITDEMEEIDEDRRMREQSGLVRSGRLFGGLIEDIKRKKPHYLSDLWDGFHPQCISSFLFLYFACLAPIVAFGGLLGEATENRIATIESLISGLISSVLFGLFAGQPLIILGSTGPVYVFEKILYSLCNDQNWDYLSLRLWIGIWVGIILFLLVMFDASAYVCYITRFTEELFATLIAFIFIFNAMKNLYGISQQTDFAPPGDDISCQCEVGPNTPEKSKLMWSNITRYDCLNHNGILEGPGCSYDPNVFLMSLVLFFGTFIISFTLKNFRNTGYFPGKIRSFLSDFAVIIAILSMTGLSALSQVKGTPKLVVPDSFKPTWEGRDWIVTHALIFPDHVGANPLWVDFVLAPVFAILATILIFMDQQITAVIVNRKEHKLVKGCGYHLDLTVLAFIIIICSVFGLPWFVAATVLSINHIQSLAKESECSAPGEKPQFLGIREQRVTAILIGVCIGLSTLITPVLALIPMPVLFGVFLFMGVSSLKGLQFFDRILLLFIPKKYQPDYAFLKYVPIHKVHLFTVIQLFSLVSLWLIKNNPTTSISFPVMLVVICAIRKLLECIFNRRELRALDDLLPESSNKTRRDGGSFFDRIHRSDWDEDDGPSDQPHDEVRQLLGSQEEKTTHFIKELEDYSKSNLKVKAKQFSAMGVRPRGKSISAGSTIQTKATKHLIFVKLNHQNVFTPLNLNVKTVIGLIRRLEAKFPGQIQPSQIEHLFQRSRRNLTFILDDDMMDFIEPNEVFDIELEENDNGKVNITLVAVEKD
ncbi:sodium bicarbonate cotransporter 3-like isoform X1 [Tigriopus californicus]|uniref:sodium bicarbonate cotransporter 3-like isoform X1 n=1 Tax=Tigriopus californicus TaxID=6832 RepID=UPI0027DA869E|nr:sodium bicarbonate cotransporter 3-like isoform X1 [Tigriopus californicus]